MGYRRVFGLSEEPRCPFRQNSLSTARTRHRRLAIALGLVVCFEIGGCGGPGDETGTAHPQIDNSTAAPSTVQTESARKLLEMGRLKEAERAFELQSEQASQIERLDALVGLAEICIATGRNSRAEQLLAGVLVEESTHPGANRVKALLALEHGNYVEARDRLAHLLKQSPDDEESHYLMGLLSQSQEQWEVAAIHFKKCLHLNPRNANGYFHLAEAQTELFIMGDAQKNIEAALRIKPDEPGFHQLACQIYSDTRPALALPSIDSAIKLDPQQAHSWFLRAKLYEAYAVQLQTSPETLGEMKRDAPLAIQRATGRSRDLAKVADETEVVRIREAMWSLCLADIEEAAAKSSRPARFLLFRGRVKARRGKLDEAIGDFSLAAKDLQLQYEATYERALALWLLGRHADATAVVDAVLVQQSTPSAAAIPLLLFKCQRLLRNDRRAKAIATLKRVSQKFPDRVDVLNELARLLHEGGANAEAIETAERAQRLAPTEPEVVVALGAYLDAAGRRIEAVDRLQGWVDTVNARFSKAAAAASVPAVLRALGQLHYRSRDTANALKAFSAAVKLDPGDDAALVWRARTRLEAENADLDAVLRDLDKATDVNPQNTMAHFIKAEILYGSGGSGLSFALEAYSSAIKSDPDFLEAYEGRVRCYRSLNATLNQEKIKEDQAMVVRLKAARSADSGSKNLDNSKGASP